MCEQVISQLRNNYMFRKFDSNFFRKHFVVDYIFIARTKRTFKGFRIKEENEENEGFSC